GEGTGGLDEVGTRRLVASPADAPEAALGVPGSSGGTRRPGFRGPGARRSRRPPASPPSDGADPRAADRLDQRRRPFALPARVLPARRLRTRPDRPRGLWPAHALRVLGPRGLAGAGGPSPPAALAHGAGRGVGPDGPNGRGQAGLRAGGARRGDRPGPARGL